jgi:protein SCO1/2
MNTHAPITTISRSARALGAIAALAMASAAAAQLARPGDEYDSRPVPVRGLELQNKLGASVPRDLPFTTSDGRQIRLGDLFPGKNALPGKGIGAAGKPVLLTMIYYRCPVLCPTMMEKLTDGLNALDLTVGADFNVVVVSFDMSDTPDAAAREKTGRLLMYNRPTTDSVRDGWVYLTGLPENARALADAIGFPYRYLPAANEYSHGPVVFVMTPEGKVSRYLTGFEYPPQLVTDLKFSLMDASGGKVGSVFEQLALWCYHWKPEDGSYSVQAMRVVQLGSGITAIALGATIAMLFVHERRRRAAAPARHASVPSSPSLELSGQTP